MTSSAIAATMNSGILEVRLGRPGTISMDQGYETTEPTREAIDALRGAALIEFGSPGCGYCRQAQPLIASALARHPAVRHLKIADAKGRPPGRSYGVKLWPTLVFLRDGEGVERLPPPPRPPPPPP